MWKIVGNNFMNADLIFPTQQGDVYKIIKCCENNENIKKLTIFGSSVTSACNPWSDIDIYIEYIDKPNLDYPLNNYSNGNPVDIWDNFMVRDCDCSDLLKEINSKGVVVYER